MIYMYIDLILKENVKNVDIIHHRNTITLLLDIHSGKIPKFPYLKIYINHWYLKESNYRTFHNEVTV